MENKNYKIVGHKYSTEKSYYDWDKNHKYPTFKEIDSCTFYHEAKSLDEVHLWMLENHPDYAIGCAIKCLSNTDFLIDAVPDYYVGELGLFDETDFSKIVDYSIKKLKERLKIAV